MLAVVWSVTYSCVASIRSHATHDQQAMCEVCSGSEGRRRGRTGTVKGRHNGKEVRRKHHENITSYFAVAQLARSCAKQSLHMVNGMYQSCPYSSDLIEGSPECMEDWNHSSPVHIQKRNLLHPLCVMKAWG
jgi:hypothetical protein